MNDYPILLGAAALALSASISGAKMLSVRAARAPAAALVLGGIGLFAGVVLARTDQSAAAERSWLLAGLLLLPLAATTYPRPSRHPVDATAVAVVAVGGVTGSLWWDRAGTVDQPGVVWTVAITSVVVLVLHTWWKLERLDQPDRGAVLWMALAGTIGATVTFFSAFLTQGTAGQAGSVGTSISILTLAIIPPAMYVGLRRQEVVDVRALVVSGVVLLTALLTYLAVFATAQALLELLADGPPSVGALGVVAALAAMTFHPLQVALRGVIDELLFGRRPDPLDAAGQVATRVGDDPQHALDAIREALVLPFAEISVGDSVIATSGKRVSQTRSLPLALGGEQDGEQVGEQVGELEVGLRPGDLGLSASDIRVLTLTAPLLAQTLRARALTRELQESREQTITALEEERRRLRRDLHDGLGPRLSGIAFTSDAARNTIAKDPAAAGELLRSVRAETVGAIEEIRRLVYAMRPPALDELGLVPALRQAAATLTTPTAGAFIVTVHADGLPPLTAALEVAAYRIALEALTNAARHSGTNHATASLRVEERGLVVEVRDGGTSPGDWAAGVGLSSMRERAAELLGTVTTGHTVDGGLVRAVLPLPADTMAP